MQKKSIVTVLIVAGALVLSSTPIFAQAAQSSPSTAAQSQASIDQDIQLLRQDVQSGKKQVVAANMSLTDAESTKFWPIYDQYAAEAAKIGDSRVALIRSTRRTTAT